MKKFFFLPIISGIILGVLFPFQSLSLVGYSSILLFVLMSVNTSTLKMKDIFKEIRRDSLFLALNLVLMYLFLPVIQAALAVYLIDDVDFQLGFMLCALAPAAIVIPFFATERGGDYSASALIVVVSTLVAPFVMSPVARLLGFNQSYLNSQSFFLFSFAVTVLPLATNILTGKVLPRFNQWIFRHQTLLNSLLLGALICILSGASFNKMHWRHFYQWDVLILIVLFIWADFGVYYLSRIIGRLYLSRSRAETLALAAATRNLAIPAGLLLIFHPRAAIPAALGFAIHAFFFQWLLLPQKDKN